MDHDDHADTLAAQIGEGATRRGITVGVAESLTGGLVVQALARAEGASDWLCGGVVAYARTVKHQLLEVRADKVVSEQAAAEMAGATRRVLGADIAVAVTGVGGPEEQDGEPPGTVWIAVDDGARSRTALHQFDGDPASVCERARLASLRMLGELMAGEHSGQ